MKPVYLTGREMWCIVNSVEFFGHCNTTLTNQTVKLLHELERLRRMRAGEGVPAPMTADVTVSAEGVATATLDVQDGAAGGLVALPAPDHEGESRNEPNLAQLLFWQGVNGGLQVEHGSSACPVPGRVSSQPRSVQCPSGGASHPRHPGPTRSCMTS